MEIVTQGGDEMVLDRPVRVCSVATRYVLLGSSMTSLRDACRVCTRLYPATIDERRKESSEKSLRRSVHVWSAAWNTSET